MPIVGERLNHAAGTRIAHVPCRSVAPVPARQIATDNECFGELVKDFAISAE